MTTVETVDEGAVHGFLHRPASVSFASPVATLALTHGAGSNCDTVLLRAVADGFAAAGVQVLRFDLAFQVRRASRASASVACCGGSRGHCRGDCCCSQDYSVPGPVLLGGHSYGGRQASMLAAENRDLSTAWSFSPIHCIHRRSPRSSEPNTCPN
ncbi:alpha/beta family hydrolase [Rhodococcus sp. 3Y1]